MKSKLFLKVLKLGSAVGTATLAGVCISNKIKVNFPNKFHLEAKDLDNNGINNLYMGTGSKWDKDWDLRDPVSVVRKPKDDSVEKLAEYQKELEKAKPKASRILVLVRHGQYNLSGTEDDERYLTELGRKQAALTGERLNLLFNEFLEPKKDDNGNVEKPRIRLVKSTMKRATETGDIIHSHLPGLNIDSCDLIREGAPCPPDPPTDKWCPDPWDFFQEGSRIEAGFRKYFHRADPSQSETSVDILVCHGNVIRYFVCRALQLDPAAWLRMSVHNGSITILEIRPSGNVSLRQVGEAGHFPPQLLTFN
ncbi:serine/threonine-protein phosphatase PGAM5, mitochondrial [Eurytemora carolleeae]|uniref:serine/threonine-protein phosphatase PGAM5, mitochondrial n=1 Tax=Eurytemora carolleeae TaxID=1294199 RepID=UPI000C76860B|nr:serine/threonine-protein phosphatase PGAM5, mitochondrial [Eurytemora carolleeae]|eukprot:XP_023335751.1 serine/threonine-protein phosphatase PGAM5, mitochondrial-like [Eurytemora affinis]